MEAAGHILGRTSFISFIQERYLPRYEADSFVEVCFIVVFRYFSQ
jgi:hypothetical protein